MQDVKVEFKTWLSARRLEKGLTLDAMGQALGSHKGYMSGIMAGKVNPPSEKMCSKMATLFKENSEYVTYLAYRSKAPEAVQKRIEALEELLQLWLTYQGLEASPPSGETDHRSALKAALVDVRAKANELTLMFRSSKNGNGNGHSRK